MKKKLFISSVLSLLLLTDILAETNSTKDTKGSKIWDSTLMLGTQVLPRYNKKTGENEGLKDTRFFLKLNVDSRWYVTNDNNSSKFKDLKNRWIVNSGVDIELLGTPVTDSNKTAITVRPESFSDVSDSLQATAYIQFIPSYKYLNINKYSDLGFIAHIGGLTRDKKDSDDESTLNKFYGAGVQYTFFEDVGFVGENKNIYDKEYPAGKFLITLRQYDYFAGKKDVYRTIIDFEYQLLKERSVYIGLNANTGPGPDIVYLKFAVTIDLNDFFTDWNILRKPIKSSRQIKKL